MLRARIGSLPRLRSHIRHPPVQSRFGGGDLRAPLGSSVVATFGVFPVLGALGSSLQLMPPATSVERISSTEQSFNSASMVTCLRLSFASRKLLTISSVVISMAHLLTSIFAGSLRVPLIRNRPWRRYPRLPYRFSIQTPHRRPACAPTRLSSF